MMDKALLESAARVAGIPSEHHDEWDAIVRTDERDQYGRGVLWRPHADDADAFRQAVTLRIEPGRAVAEQCDHPDVHELWQKYEIAATRRAILRSAASMDRLAGNDAMSQQESNAEEPIKSALVSMDENLVVELVETAHFALNDVDAIERVSEETGVPVERLEAMAGIFIGLSVAGQADHSSVDIVRTIRELDSEAAAKLAELKAEFVTN